MTQIGSFLVLLILLMFIYTLLGQELFAHKIRYNELGNVDENGTSPRENFDDFLHGFTTIFICLIGDDWNLVMYSHARASNTYFSLVEVFFFTSIIVIGNWIMLNLFLAILLSHFEDEEEEEEDV